MDTRRERRPHKRNKNQTGCHACRRKHNTNKTAMVSVVLPGGSGTVRVCKAKADGYEKV